MHTRNSHFPGSRHVHYSELSAVPLDVPMALAHQRDNRVDNRHRVRPKLRHRLNSQDYTMSRGIERQIPTATVAGPGVDRHYWEDVGRVPYHQPERTTPRQGRECRTSFDRRQHRTQVFISSLPRTPAASNGVNQSYVPARTTAQTVLLQDRPDLNVLPDEYHQLPQAERHRLRALLPQPIPLVSKDKPSKATFLERLNPFRYIRSLSTPSTVPKRTTIVVIPIENSAHSRCRSIARQA